MLKSSTKTYWNYLGLLSAALLPVISSAQCAPPSTGSGIKFSVCSPLDFGGPTAFQDFLVAILNIIIIIATPIVVLAIIYAGFLYVTARGNVQQTQQATRALTYSIIGGVLILGALALTQIISNLVGAFTATP